MKFRTVMVTAAAAALSFTAASSAAAQTLGHAGQHRAARQITGSRLAKGLLPASAFGSDFTNNGSGNTGRKLLSTRIRQTPGSLSCGTFSNTVYAGGWGNTAGAFVSWLNQDEASGWPATDFTVGEVVYQFATAHAASTYFNQSYAKYAACRSFAVANPSDNTPGGGTYDVSDTSTRKTTVSGHQAFVNSQYWVPSEGTINFLAFYAESLYAISGKNVYFLWQITGEVNPVSPKFMSSLIHRVQGLYK